VVGFDLVAFTAPDCELPFLGRASLSKGVIRTTLVDLVVSGGYGCRAF